MTQMTSDSRDQGGDVSPRITRPRDHLLDHEYDGIREFDNPTPGWWHLIFLGSVVFSIFYFVFWQFSPLAYTPQEAWAAKQNAETMRLFANVGDIKPDQDGILTLMRDDKLMAYAQGMFQGNCAQCHAKDGGGINGTNLTDDHYKNVKALPDLFAVITAGAANGAMPAWRNNFSEKERVLLAAYAARLRGTTPANARQAEGEAIAPWPR
ncbi:MAG: cbb3-type cytochrome c oxidase N-terminal domain-containing protein [Planctomycetota bacterium]|nr:cbb3-type cytochrome c oxidase N-terminal domain-containing protein [Planctomycetota bacterium]